MAKTNQQRFADAWHTIGAVVGVRAHEVLLNGRPSVPQQEQMRLGGRIGLQGGGIGVNDQERQRRALVRAILLTVAMQDDPPRQDLDRLRGFLRGQPAQRLRADLTNRFPFDFLNGSLAGRALWAPNNFTDPKQHSRRRFRYIVHGVTLTDARVARRGAGATAEETAAFNASQQRFRGFVHVDVRSPGTVMQREDLMLRSAVRYLNEPNRLRFDVVSCSAIDQDHVASYFPWGFILSVPAENIVSARDSDQGVANRAQDLLGELRRVHTANGFPGPAAVLANTKAGGQTGYNELVVAGTTPRGTMLSVVGIFVKSTADRRFLYTRQGQDGPDAPYVTPEFVRLIKRCARRNDFPIIKVPDAMSGPSSVPWPFNPPGEPRGRDIARLLYPDD